MIIILCWCEFASILHHFTGSYPEAVGAELEFGNLIFLIIKSMKDLNKQLIKDFTEVAGKNAIALLKFLELKSHIKGTGIFDVDNESYEFDFSLKKLNGEIVKRDKVCNLKRDMKDCAIADKVGGCDYCNEYKPD